MDVASFLLTTRGGTFISGFSLAVGVIASLTSLAFYFEYRKKFLLHFTFANTLVYVLLAIVNHDPRNLIDMDGDPVFFRVYHSLAALTHLTFYFLVSSTLGIRRKSFETVMWLAVSARLLPIFVPSASSVFAAVCFTSLYLIVMFFLVLRWNPPTTSHMFAKLSMFGFFSLLLYFTLTRLGVTPTIESESFIPTFFSGGLAFCSSIWLLALSRIAAETGDEIRVDERKKNGIVLGRLQALISSPLAFLTLSLEVSGNGIETDLSRKMKRSVGRLARVGRFMERLSITARRETK